MNSIQLSIIIASIVLILIVIGYYLYQEAKFKKMVENNFNQATADIIIANKNVVLDGIEQMPDNIGARTLIQTDTYTPFSIATKDPLLGDDISSEETIPEDSVEAFFIKVDKINFPFCAKIDKDLDLIIDIVFEEPKKLKSLPEITPLTQKAFIFYVLTKDNEWQVFEKNEKYIAKALKLVVHLVDREGIISQAQINNIYKELYNFVLQNQAHIRKSNYEDAIANIQLQLKHLNSIERDLKLYLILKEPVNYNQLLRFFVEIGFTLNNGRLILIDNQVPRFMVSDENNYGLNMNEEYKMLLISSKMHLQSDPHKAIEQILDMAERFTAKFEARLLTSSKQVFGQRDYDNLNRLMTNYVVQASKNAINLSNQLIWRLF